MAGGPMGGQPEQYRIAEILFRLDPVGINFEDNTDEYETVSNAALDAASAEIWTLWLASPLRPPQT